jgi:hypothetical protein
MDLDRERFAHIHLGLGNDQTDERQVDQGGRGIGGGTGRVAWDDLERKGLGG